MADAHLAPLIQFTIYDHPADFPEHFVVRCWLIHPGSAEVTPEVWLRPTLEAARQVIERNAPGLYRLDPMEGDDPVIAEVWI